MPESMEAYGAVRVARFCRAFTSSAGRRAGTAPPGHVLGVLDTGTLHETVAIYLGVRARNHHQQMLHVDTTRRLPRTLSHPGPNRTALAPDSTRSQIRQNILPYWVRGLEELLPLPDRLPRLGATLHRVVEAMRTDYDHLVVTLPADDPEVAGMLLPLLDTLVVGPDAPVLPLPAGLPVVRVSERTLEREAFKSETVLTEPRPVFAVEARRDGGAPLRDETLDDLLTRAVPGAEALLEWEDEPILPDRRSSGGDAALYEQLWYPAKPPGERVRFPELHRAIQDKVVEMRHVDTSEVVDVVAAHCRHDARVVEVLVTLIEDHDGLLRPAGVAELVRLADELTSRA